MKFSGCGSPRTQSTGILNGVLKDFLKEHVQTNDGYLFMDYGA